MPIAPLIGLAGSIGGSILGRPRSQQQSSSSESRPYYTDTQTSLQGPLAKLLRQMLKGKETQLDRRLKASAGDYVNQNARGIQGSLDTLLTRRGFGESGKHNLNTVGLELERGRNLTNAYLGVDQDRANRQLSAIGQAAGIAFNPSGSNTTSTGTLPGQSIGQSLGPVVTGAGGDLATWLAGRSGYGGGGPQGPYDPFNTRR